MRSYAEEAAAHASTDGNGNAERRHRSQEYEEASTETSHAPDAKQRQEKAEQQWRLRHSGCGARGDGRLCGLDGKHYRLRSGRRRQRRGIETGRGSRRQAAHRECDGVAECSLRGDGELECCALAGENGRRLS